MAQRLFRNKVVMGIAPVYFACAMMLLGSSLFLQGCFGRSAPVYAPLPPREPDYAFQNEMSRQISSLKEEVLALRSQNSQKDVQNEAEMRELRKREAELKDKVEKWERKEAELKQQEEEARNYPIPRFLQVSNHLNKVNIAVTGASGTGKSHLNNAIRMVKRHDPAWAPVGVTETTQDPTMYNFPDQPLARIWDLPGAGTPKWPLADYIRKVGLRHFDAVLVVCAERFTEADLLVMEELQQHRVPYFAVRQKLGQAIQSNLQVNGIEVDQTKQQIVDYLRDQGVQQPYLIDSFEPELHDLPKLRREVLTAILRNRHSEL